MNPTFKKQFSFLFFALIFVLSIKAQNIDSIIERTLDALGGRANFNNLTSVYKEGIYFEDGEENQADAAVTVNGEYYKVQEYYIPFQGKKVINNKNKDTVVNATIYNLESAWEFSESTNPNATNKFLEIAPVPKYRFYTIFYGTKKYSFNYDNAINNYSNEVNTVYDGFELKHNKRYIRLICNKMNLLYIDAITYLPYLYIERFKDQKLKKEILIEYFLEDYRMTSAGIKMPFRIKQNTVGTTIPTIFRYNKIETNKVENIETLLSASDVAKEFKKRNRRLKVKAKP